MGKQDTNLGLRYLSRSIVTGDLLTKVPTSSANLTDSQLLTSFSSIFVAVGIFVTIEQGSNVAGIQSVYT